MRCLLNCSECLPRLARFLGFCILRHRSMRESALTNKLSPGDKTISSRLGQFSLLWISQLQRYHFDVDVIECEWVAAADLEILKQKLQADWSHLVKAIRMHNETSSKVTNDIGAARRILGKQVNHVIMSITSIYAIESKRDRDLKHCHGVGVEPQSW